MKQRSAYIVFTRFSFGRRFLLGLLILSSAFTNNVYAQKVYDFNATCIQAYTEVNKLKIAPATALIAKAKQQNPQNLIPVLLDAYTDFYVLFLLENPADYAQRFKRFEQTIDALKDGPKNNPLYNYCLSNVYIHRAMVSLKFGHFWDAGWDIRRSFMLADENHKKFPAFTGDDLLYGALQGIVGTVPKGYQWLTNLLGMRGSQKQGMTLVANFANGTDVWAKLFSPESHFIYPYLLFHLQNEKDAALAFIKDKKLDLVNNHLHAWTAANLALNHKASSETKNIIENRNKSADYLSLPFWDFELGCAKLYALDLDGATPLLTKYTEQFKGNFYIKDALQKLSWANFLKGDLRAAEAARKQIFLRGGTDTDADKQALKDAKTGVWPNPLLLKARLLTDGGYTKEALAILQGKQALFTSPLDKLEYVYRIGRIYEDMGKDAEAITFYKQTIQLGANQTAYFAARAALQAGQILEKRGQKLEAISFYEQCLSMEEHSYKNSLDQRAKAGIARCK
ncbi:MAG: tetratricopeptide repeat protein [Sediminibacterium sp.]|nr:tetratricopeptide repeat protein [Sediminibacterium sp.]